MFWKSDLPNALERFLLIPQDYIDYIEMWFDRCIVADVRPDLQNFPIHQPACYEPRYCRWQFLVGVPSRPPLPPRSRLRWWQSRSAYRAVTLTLYCAIFALSI